MDAEENLRRQKARFDDAVFAALSSLDAPGVPSQLETATAPLSRAYEYRRVLLEAAQAAPPEIAEHYRQLAQEAVPKAEFLMWAITQYRIRRGIR